MLTELESQLLAALRLARPHQRSKKIEMLNSVSSLSDAAFERVQKEPYWVATMADDEAIVAAIAAGDAKAKAAA